jgi:hypothetical protein
VGTLVLVGMLLGLAALPALFERGLRLVDRRGLLREVAQARGLQLVWVRGEPRVVGQLDGLLVEIVARPSGVRVELEVGLGPQVRVLPAGRVPDRPRTGDAAFDEVVAVVGEPAEQTLARLDAPIRARLRLVVQRYQARFGQGRWTFQCPAELTEVSSCLEHAAALARWVRPFEGLVVERLLERAERDPVPGVRLQALKLVLPRLSPSHPRLVALGSDPEPVVAFHAAMARGVDGHGQIRRLLSHPDPLVSEGTVLSLIEQPEWRAQPWLEEELVWLCTVRPSGRLIEALGEVGTAQSVPTLRALAGRGLGLGTLAGSARRALERIQKRRVLERGGLSLAPDSGAVSLAKAAQGQVSEVKKFDDPM